MNKLMKRISVIEYNFKITSSLLEKFFRTEFTVGSRNGSYFGKKLAVMKLAIQFTEDS